MGCDNLFETQMLPAGQHAITSACALLQAGEVVAIPTETVYGLAADALRADAVEKIYAAKGRPADNPLIVHVSDTAMFAKVALLDARAEKLIAAFCPGPLTMVLPKKDIVPAITCGGLNTVAVRMPSDATAHAIIQQSGLPLAAPSANLSGKPSPTNAKHVLEDMNGRIPLVVDGGESAVGVESTVVALTGDVPVLLRPGYITAGQIAQVLGEEVQMAHAVLNQMQADAPVPSPGMKYKHYAPNAQVTIIQGARDAYCAYVNANKAPGTFALCYEEDTPHLQTPFVTYGGATQPNTQARELFTALRMLDEQGAQNAFAHYEYQNEVSTAVYNRLLRAAGFRVVKL
ncbi:threonylcarbamoyl-AMP synthase [Ruminococcaceae bacterium OttesenSCG-928-N02]|nr:threonylcarbamoyl-AMP synthase [Ruminococcaceae bacterium OttesenSCG-928-N02]